MFQSATRVTLLLMIVVLCGVTVFSLWFYPDSAFKDVFAVFNNILVAITSFFFGKSSGQASTPNTATPTLASPVDTLPG